MHLRDLSHETLHLIVFNRGAMYNVNNILFETSILSLAVNLRVLKTYLNLLLI